MKSLMITVLMIIAIAAPSVLFGQEYKVYLRDRTHIRGTYLGLKDEYVCYRTEKFPLVLIPLTSIKYVYKGRRNVTSLVMTNQLPAEADMVDYLSVIPDSTRITGSNTTNNTALNEIRDAIGMVAIPLWAASIASVISTIILLSK